jgi:hypothetical protein
MQRFELVPAYSIHHENGFPRAVLADLYVAGDIVIAKELDIQSERHIKRAEDGGGP